jgi:HK97 family phage portal protein
MGLFDRFKKTPQPQEVKSYSAPQVLFGLYGKTPQFNDWNTEKAIKEGFKHSTWVYSCVNLRATSAASVPWIVQQKSAEGWEKVDDPSNPLVRLVNRPNPDMSWQQMIEYAVQHLDLSGNAFWSKVRAGEQVRELWVLPPQHVRAVPGMIRLVDRYEYHLGLARRNIDPTDIIHFKYNDPNNLYFGASPLLSAAQAVDIDNEAERFQKVSLQNRGLSDLAVKVPLEATEEQVQQMRDAFNREHSGPRNARKALVTSAEITQLGTTAAELDFTESRKFIRDEICSAFGVPPPMVGSYENATLANIETARKIFWRDTMITLLQKIESFLNMQLAYEYGPQYRITYDLTSVDALQENLTEKVNNAKNLWSMGIPFNDINQLLELGFEEVAGGETGYLPSGLLPTNFSDSGAVGDETGLDAKALGVLAYGEKKDNTPPQGARDEAQKGLDWRREYGRGGTEVGVARARDIARGANLSDETIGRMVSYFARHEVDKQAEGFNSGEDGYPSAGRIAWALWGGDAGRTWADKRWAQINAD